MIALQLTQAITIDNNCVWGLTSFKGKQSPTAPRFQTLLGTWLATEACQALAFMIVTGQRLPCCRAHMQGCASYKVRLQASSLGSQQAGPGYDLNCEAHFLLLPCLVTAGLHDKQHS